ncbi:MAG: hypothetical protein ACKN9F_09760, partial [Methylomonas sp.]
MTQGTIELSRCNADEHDTSLEAWTPDMPSLVKTFSTPTIGGKSGPYFLRCPGTKRNNTDTADTAGLLILDGDSRIIEGGEVVSGAPDPAAVHHVLTAHNVSHLIYSSFSNGADHAEIEAKSIDSGGAYGADFHKYRVLIPCHYSPEQLPVILEWIIKKLHKAGVMLADVKENRTWSQPWFFPRVPDKNRRDLFKFYQHEGGKSLPIDEIYQAWQKHQTPSQEPAAFEYTAKHTGKGQSGIDAIHSFNQSYRTTEILANSGYIQRGNKWLRPGSSSKIPAVQVCQNCNDGIERVYSHGGDALNDGFAHDAFDCYRLLQ